MLRRVSILFCLLILSLTVFAQTDHPAYHKMSGWVRDIVRQEITSKQGRGEIMSASRAARHSAKKLVRREFEYLSPSPDRDKAVAKIRADGDLVAE